MIQQINTTYNNMVAFAASGAVTKDDFDQYVFPAVKELVTRTGKLNYLMKIDTPLDNFTIGAWGKDLVLGLKEFTNWNRVAIVTSSTAVQTFTDLFGWLIPGTFKGFEMSALDEAIYWVGTGETIDKTSK